MTNTEKVVMMSDMVKRVTKIIGDRTAANLLEVNHISLAAAVEGATGAILRIDDPAFWARHQPKINTARACEPVAENLILEQVRADTGLADVDLDPIRDAMDD